MILKLKIIAPTKLIDGQKNEYAFDELGGTLGRKPVNDFVLLDPERYISGKHALIECRHGHFYITDTSTNGVYLNNAKTPLGNGNSEEIMNGDKISIGPYDLLVHIAETEANKAVESPWQMREPAEVPAKTNRHHDPLAGLVSDYSDKQTPDSHASGSVDPLELLGMAADKGIDEHSPLGTPTLDDLFEETEPLPEDSSSQIIAEDILADSEHKGLIDSIENQPQPVNIDERFTPPDDFIPENWDSLDLDINGDKAAKAKQPATDEFQDIFAPVHETTPPPKHAPAQARTPSTSPTGATQSREQESELISEFLAGCGVEAQALNFADQHKLMHKMGEISRITVIGLMQALQARASLKSGFRVSKTTIAPVENNPLKFSVTADEALNILLSDDRKGYMPAVEAINEGFQDLQTHQMAMMAGMQATISAIIEQFNPLELERAFETQAASGFLPGHKKSKNWEHYVDFYNRLTERLQDDFQNIYGEQFAKAYEEQVLKLIR